MRTVLDFPSLAQENSRVHCLFHMVAEQRSSGSVHAMTSSEGMVPESSLAHNEEQELGEVDILKKQFEDSKTEQDKNECDNPGFDQYDGTLPGE